MLRPLLSFLLLTMAAPVHARPDSHGALQAASAGLPPPTLVARYGADTVQQGELRLPAGKGPFPVAVVIHGGCWDAQRGDLHATALLAEALAARGIATWNIEYRRLGTAGGGWPGTFEDVAAATDYLAVLAKTQPLDLDHVAVVGHDTGATLALWVAARPKLQDPIAGAMTVKPVTAVALDGSDMRAPPPQTDAQRCDGEATTALMGGTPTDKPAAYALADPRSRLPLGVHQLIVVGAPDEGMASYVQAALASGDTVVKLAPGGADHFNIITPQTPQGKQVADFIASQAFAE